MQEKFSNPFYRFGTQVLISLFLVLSGLTTLEAATISTVKLTDTSCPQLFKIRIEGTFNDNDRFSGYDFFRTRVFGADNTLIHECACGVAVGGTVFGPPIWYLFDPPPDRNPLRFEIYEDDDQQLPFGDLLMVQHLDYDCLAPTNPIFLDGFESGDCAFWSGQEPPAPVKDQSQETIDYGYWFEDDVIRWQEFIPTLNNLTSVEIHVHRNGSPGNIIVEVATATDVVLGQALIPGDSVAEWGWTRAVFNEPVSLTPGDRFRLRVYSDADSPSPANRYFWEGTRYSEYCPECLTDVSDVLPDYDYAFRTYGYP